MAAQATTRGIVEKSHLLSKFQGCLVGALVGDCVGALFEFSDDPQLKGLQACVDNLSSSTGDRSREIYDFTDDTAMARSVAKSLIQNKGINVMDMAKRFTEEYFKEPNRGYGASVSGVFSALKESNYQDPHGPAQLQFEGRGSYGNGGAMRISPLALFAFSQTMETMQKEVEDITKITHSNRDAILGAQLQCAAVHYALHKEPPLVTTDFLDHLVSLMQSLECDDGELNTQESDGKTTKPDKRPVSQKMSYSAKLKKIKEIISQDEIDDQKTVEILGNDVSALGSVPAAIYSFVRAQKPMDHIPRSNDGNAFTRTIIHAISLGGDTDTIATMAGAISGALYGLGSIPQNFQDVCEGLEDYLQFAKDFTDIVQNT